MKKANKKKEKLENKALFFLKSFGSLEIWITFAVRPSLKIQDTTQTKLLNRELFYNNTISLDKNIYCDSK